MNIAPNTANVTPCETDFVVIGEPNYDERVPLAIGECKSHKEITEEDVQHLAQVADAFPARRVKCYIVFAKTSKFSPDEIIRCRKAQTQYGQRVILLSDRELEPYFVYEETQKEFDIRPSAISFEDLAKATHNIYFDPRRKRNAGPTTTSRTEP